MYPSIKKYLWGLFVIYSIMSIASLSIKMSFYPKALIILSIPLIYIRLANTMINPSITIGITFLLIFNLYLFWDNLILINILAYITALALIGVFYLDYINVIATYEFFRHTQPSENEVIYYLKVKINLLLVMPIGLFLISLLSELP